MQAKSSTDAGTVQFKYAQADNLRCSQDANQPTAGQVAFTTYDFAGRPLVSGHAAADFGALNPFTSAAFDGTDANNKLVVRQYDAKPSTAVFPWNLFGPEITNSTLTNVTGRLAAVASKSNDAWQVTLFSYDTDGRVATRYTFAQDNSGTQVVAATNTTIDCVRDLRDALTERRLTVGLSTWSQWYEYDGRGLVWQVFASPWATKPAASQWPQRRFPRPARRPGG